MSRTPDHSIDEQFVNRWSPRAMSGEPIAEAELLRLFEAARWAPSCANNQPWRFIYGLAQTPYFTELFNVLADGNKPWCKNAGALVLLVSRDTFDNGKPAVAQSLDSGAAWMSFALQACKQGLVVHGMKGFDPERARVDLQIPAGYTCEMMIAVAHPGPLEVLPEPYRPREVPSDRHPVSSFAFAGRLIPR